MTKKRGGGDGETAGQLSFDTWPVPEAALHDMSQARSREVVPPVSESQSSAAPKKGSKRQRAASHDAAATTGAAVAASDVVTLAYKFARDLKKIHRIKQNKNASGSASLRHFKLFSGGE